MKNREDKLKEVIDFIFNEATILELVDLLNMIQVRIRNILKGDKGD